MNTLGPTTTSLVPRYTMPHDRYAVVINNNAGRVTRRTRARVRRLVPADRLHLTESPEHAREVLHKCIEDEVGTIFAGGGDGTIIDTINTLSQLREPDLRMPDVGVLRLGTGNALARWVGSGSPKRDLLRWQGGMVHKVVPMELVEAEDTLFPFAGLGYDAAVLNDYIWLKKQTEKRGWDKLAMGIKGYALAAALRTIPNYWNRPAAKVRVINLGRPAHRIGPDGAEHGAAVPTGGTIYEGSCTMLAAATMPLYGYGVKMFPFATNRAGRFQLRVFDFSPLMAVRYVPQIWRGTLRHPAMHDFYADRVRIVFDQAMPYQLGGDARGYRREITFGLGEVPVNLLGQA